MFDKIFKICLLVLGGGLLFTLFESTQNGRYLYSQENDTALIVDTRTGITYEWKNTVFVFDPKTGSGKVLQINIKPK